MFSRFPEESAYFNSAIHSELGITDLNLRGALGAGAPGGGLGYAGSIGAARGAANLQTLQGLQGLEEGFHRLKP